MGDGSKDEKKVLWSIRKKIIVAVLGIAIIIVIYMAVGKFIFNIDPFFQIETFRTRCQMPWADCDNNRSNGCEVDLSSDPEHCGDCYTHCVGGNCQSWQCTCSSGLSLCSQDGFNQVCVDLQSDENNCGSCGNQCSASCTDNGTTCSKENLHWTGCCCVYGQCYEGEGYIQFPLLPRCFPAGTLVATQNSFIPISMIKAGDIIPGYDVNTGQVALLTVTSVTMFANQSIVILEFMNESVTCTPRQPFWTGAWTQASELKAGDKVLCRDNHWEVLMKDPYPAGIADVYSLQVSPSHSYYVGSPQILVHNSKL